MCGRYTLSAKIETLVKKFLLKKIQEFKKSDWLPRYNIGPGNKEPTKVFIVRQDEDTGERMLAQNEWPLIPSWSKVEENQKRPTLKYDTKNAKSDTAATKPSFRVPMRSRRCLIPASGFFEWQGTEGAKQPYYIRPKDEELFAFAGLWDRWSNEDQTVVIESCTILTTTPNSLMAKIHHRMPVILQEEQFEPWLDTKSHPVSEVKNLLKPYPYPERMVSYPVSTLVNNPKVDSPELLDEIDPEKITFSPKPKKPTLTQTELF